MHPHEEKGKQDTRYLLTSLN